MSILTIIKRIFNPQRTAAIQPPQVDDTHPGAWAATTVSPHDYDSAKVMELYSDALTAWRKNPLAWRIVAITSDYVAGDGISLSSPYRSLRRFINEFWHHPKNQLHLRLEAMCDELTRAGDLFVLLFRNPQDGMSYVRFITKDRIRRIESAANDYETELAYEEVNLLGESTRWLSPQHPESSRAGAIMLHYAINRPLGALLGESDLTSMLPWLMRYSRMLEDRVRLHWAVRSFLWLVTVPTNKIREKQQQYAYPPEAGAIIIKDDAEQWQAVTPNLNANDAQADLKAVRGMIDAGSGFPPHWRGEAADANLATATAMQAPTERHLLRRQQYFLYILQDITYQAYQRAYQLGKVPQLTERNYDKLFTALLPDISRTDNESLAKAAHMLAQTYQVLGSQLPHSSPTLTKLFTSLILNAGGNPLSEELLEKILQEIYLNHVSK